MMYTYILFFTRYCTNYGRRGYGAGPGAAQARGRCMNPISGLERPQLAATSGSGRGQGIETRN